MLAGLDHIGYSKELRFSLNHKGKTLERFKQGRDMI